MEPLTSCDASRSSRSHATGDFHGDGEDVSAQIPDRKSNHRPRRSAAQRREQLARSHTRMITKLVGGLLSIRNHRGNALSKTGQFLLQDLQRNAECAQSDNFRYHEDMPYERAHRPFRTMRLQQSEATTRICRHWQAGRCTYGSLCRFVHQSNGEADAYGRNHKVAHDLVNPDVDDANYNRHFDERHGHAETDAADATSSASEAFTDEGLARSEVHYQTERYGDAPPDYEVYPEDPTWDQNDGSAGITRNPDSPKPHKPQMHPEFYHIAACMRTRNTLKRFAEAADEWLAAYHAENLEVEQDQCHDGQEDASQHGFDDAEDALNILSTLDRDGRRAAIELMPEWLREEVNIRMSHVDEHGDSCDAGDSSSRASTPSHQSATTYDGDVVNHPSQDGAHDDHYYALASCLQGSICAEDANTCQDIATVSLIAVYAELEKSRELLSRRLNKNRKLVARQMKAMARCFDGPTIRSMMIYVADQTDELRDQLLRQLPPECSLLEQQAMLHIYGKFEAAGSIVNTIDDSLNLYARIAACILSQDRQRFEMQCP